MIIINYNNRKIELHDRNPFNSLPTPSEKIVIRDLPLDMPGDDVINFIEHNFPHIILRSGAIMERLPSRENNDDRVVYAKVFFTQYYPNYQ